MVLQVVSSMPRVTQLKSWLVSPIFPRVVRFVQLVLRGLQVFSNLAIQTKRKAPNAHTFLEIIKVRYGTFVHLSFLFFSLSANTVSIRLSGDFLLSDDSYFHLKLVVSSVLIGGAAAINALTGMSSTLFSLVLSFLWHHQTF